MPTRPKPLVLRIQHAVCASQLDREARHLLMVMALLADGLTGVGFSSQETLARALGCSSRHVRKLLADLTKDPASPVLVTRRRRGAALGRTSDEYRLQVVEEDPSAEVRSEKEARAKAEQYSSSESYPKRNAVPLGVQTQPEQCATRSGTVRHPKRNARSGGQRRDQRSDQRSLFASRGQDAQKPTVAGAHELKVFYVESFLELRKVKPEFGRRWSRAMKAFGELVTDHGLESSKLVVRRALSDAFARRVNPWELADDAMRWLGEAPGRPGVRTPTPPQRGVVSEAEAQAWGSESPLAKKLAGGSE